jgi:hypothetical protein
MFTFFVCSYMNFMKPANIMVVAGDRDVYLGEGLF